MLAPCPDGFNLHAAVRVAPHDVEALERLCRYVQRPPLSHDRLTQQADGTLFLKFPALRFRVFGADALACPHCDGRLRVHAVIQGRWATRRVLGCLGRPSATPRLWSARGPPAAA